MHAVLGLEAQESCISLMNPRSPCRDRPKKHPSQRGQSPLHDLPSSSGAPHQAFPPPSLFWKGHSVKHRFFHLREPDVAQSGSAAITAWKSPDFGNSSLRHCWCGLSCSLEGETRLGRDKFSGIIQAKRGGRLVHTCKNTCNITITHCLLPCDQAHYLLIIFSAIRLIIPTAPRTVCYPECPSLSFRSLALPHPVHAKHRPPIDPPACLKIHTTSYLFF